MSTNDKTHVLILGGGYAGLNAARRLAKEPRLAVTLVDGQAGFVERIRLHEVAAGAAPRTLLYGDLLEPLGVRFRQGRVTALDAGEPRITLRHQDGTGSEVAADFILYALGSQPDKRAIPGLAEHGTTLSDPWAAAAVHQRVRALPTPRLLVVGGGLTAIEAAAEWAERLPGAAVTLIAEHGLQPGDGPGAFGPKAMEHMRRTLARLGVGLYEGEKIVRLDAGLAVTATGAAIPFDACLVATGFTLPPLARDAGLAVAPDGRILTDGYLRSTSHPAILAAGDCALALTAEGLACRMSCATALPMGAAAAAAIAALAAGKAPPPFTFTYAMRNVSLGRHDGVIQFLDDEDRPLRQVWTGRKAARWKEFICRMTLASVGFAAMPKPPFPPPPHLIPRLTRRAGEAA